MYGAPYNPPDFCDACGAAHPWAGREARLFELENILDEQDLDEPTRLKVQDELEALRSNVDMDTEEEQERWGRIKKLAPGLVQAGGHIIESVVTAAVKAQLDL